MLLDFFIDEFKPHRFENEFGLRIAKLFLISIMKNFPDSLKKSHRICYSEIANYEYAYNIIIEVRTYNKKYEPLYYASEEFINKFCTPELTIENNDPIETSDFCHIYESEETDNRSDNKDLMRNTCGHTFHTCCLLNHITYRDNLFRGHCPECDHYIPYKNRFKFDLSHDKIFACETRAQLIEAINSAI